MRNRQLCARFLHDRGVRSVDGFHEIGNGSSVDHRICLPDVEYRCQRRIRRCDRCSLGHRRLCVCPNAGSAGLDQKEAALVRGLPGIVFDPCCRGTTPGLSDPKMPDL